MVAAPSREFPAEAYAAGADLSWLGWWVLVLAGSVAVYSVATRSLNWRRQGAKSKGGRWVRDRSLGGKMVFIPDRPIAPTRPLWDLDEGPSERRPAPSSRRLDAAHAEDDDDEAGPLPEWWLAAERAASPGVGPAALEPLERRARALVRDMENGKVVGAQDYSLARLAELASLAPAAFVHALATALGESPARATELARAELAAAARRLIVAAEAASRQAPAPEQDQATVEEARALARLARDFSLPPRSEEAEAVAASVARTVGLAVRRRLFLQSAAFAKSLPAAHALAELLGFEPELVLPQLVTLMDDGRDG
ncbi:hypothetical protein QBZ16_003292 [Prototheca wickerhamii]|uniref:Uncharacterized protein n=1 Tax=Prototheca wickerhamii TaxID=3111 RepID=A0AAD9MII0_PROWI|nr:hypothetical protein QBZ16_003292 [Prototheca wickerhamii]